MTTLTVTTFFSAFSQLTTLLSFKCPRSTLLRHSSRSSYETPSCIAASIVLLRGLAYSENSMVSLTSSSSPRPGFFFDLNALYCAVFLIHSSSTDLLTFSSMSHKLDGSVAVRRRA
eukprot:g15655.t1